MTNTHKGFANIVLIVLVVILAGMVGYFVLHQGGSEYEYHYCQNGIYYKFQRGTVDGGVTYYDAKDNELASCQSLGIPTGRCKEVVDLAGQCSPERPAVRGTVLPGSIPIQAEFPNKFVYTTDQNTNVEALKADCAKRGGRFNTCGSPCATDAEACIEVCAFTCEFPSRDETSTPSLPTSCKDEPGGVSVITSLSSYSAPVGTKLEIRGCNFSGFEQDTNAWIANSQGVKGLLYGEAGSTSKLLKVTLKSQLCQKDTSYSGLPCDAWLTLAPATYKVYTMPWGKKSNEVGFTVK